MKSRLRLFLSFAISLLLLGLFIWGFVRLSLAIWHRFAALDPNLAVGLLTTCTTLLVAVLGLILGRLLERKKEIEAHFRDKKIAIYDEFMKEFFQVYYGDEDKSSDLVEFLRNWQRQAMLWGGSSVL